MDSGAMPDSATPTAPTRTKYNRGMGLGSRNAMYALLPDDINHLWERADGGDGKAQYELAMYFLTQRRNADEAYIWFSVGAESGNASCMLWIAELYRSGYGVPEINLSIAEDFYRRALEKGEAFDARCTGALAVLQKAFPEVKA